MWRQGLHGKGSEQDWLLNLQAQCNVKMQDPSFKNYEEFQDINSRALQPSVRACVTAQFAFP